jgi:hypothetical protein
MYFRTCIKVLIMRVLIIMRVYFYSVSTIDSLQCRDINKSVNRGYIILKVYFRIALSFWLSIIFPLIFICPPKKAFCASSFLSAISWKSWSLIVIVQSALPSLSETLPSPFLRSTTHVFATIIIIYIYNYY